MLLAAGFAGDWHPAGDSLAVFRVPLLIVAALAIIWSDWPRRARWSLAVLAMAGLVAHLPLPRGQSAEPGALMVFQQNMQWNRSESADWLAMIEAVRPDVLLLQEISEGNRALLTALAPLYPHQHLCPNGFVGEAVLSRLPFTAEPPVCSKRDGIAAAQVETRQGPVWMISLHISWPWPYGQARHVTQIIPDLQRLDGPVVLGGDFNAVAWSHTLERVARATGTVRIGPLNHSFTLPGGLPIGIDHLLAPTGTRATVQQTDMLGADHRGLLAALSLP